VIGDEGISSLIEIIELDNFELVLNNTTGRDRFEQLTRSNEIPVIYESATFHAETQQILHVY